MAIVQLGPLVANARGSLGGVTFSDSSGGVCVKARTRPSGRKTRWSFKAHSALNATQNAWIALSAKGHATYAAMASQLHRTNALGMSKPVSARSAFFSHNLKYYAASTFLTPYLPTLGPTQAYRWGFVTTQSPHLLRIKLFRDAPYTDCDIFVYFVGSSSGTHKPYSAPKLLDLIEITGEGGNFNFYFTDELGSRLGAFIDNENYRIELLAIEPNRWAGPRLVLDWYWGTQYLA